MFIIYSPSVTITVETPTVNVTNTTPPGTDPTVLARLTALEAGQTALSTHMGQLDDQIAANKAATDAEQVELDAAVARETTDFASMSSQISTLTSTVATLTAAAANGTATPAQLQSLADIQAANVKMTEQLKNLDPAVVLPPPTPSPVPDPNAPPANPPATGP